MRIGVLGIGNIGSMLARAYAQDPDCEVCVYNRTPYKAQALAQACPRIRAVSSAEEILRWCELIFLCTKAADGLAVMKSTGHLLQERQMLVTTISTVPIHVWESLTSARVAIAIPSIVQSAKSGVILLVYGSRFQPEEQEMLERRLTAVAAPFEIEERQIRVCSDLTSCGPAIISYLLQQWARAAAATGKLSVAEAEHLLCKTLIGVGELLKSECTLTDIINKVAIPSGVTEAGIRAIADLSGQMFCAMHSATERHIHGGPTDGADTPSQG